MAHYQLKTIWNTQTISQGGLLLIKVSHWNITHTYIVKQPKRNKYHSHIQSFIQCLYDRSMIALNESEYIFCHYLISYYIKINHLSSAIKMTNYPLCFYPLFFIWTFKVIFIIEHLLINFKFTTTGAFHLPSRFQIIAFFWRSSDFVVLIILDGFVWNCEACASVHRNFDPNGSRQLSRFCVGFLGRLRVWICEWNSSKRICEIKKRW